MIDQLAHTVHLAWPITIICAWLAGEFAHRWLGTPRITLYAITGFAMAPSQIGFLQQSAFDLMLLIANIAFGLILFEAGHRINLRWLKANPWIGITSITESTMTFVAIYWVATWFGLPPTTALLMAALAMATSPATVVYVVNEQKSSGQVTERALHLSVLNCVWAVLAFKIIVGLVVFKSSGSLWQATNNSLMVLAVSAGLGGLFGVAVPALLRTINLPHADSTLAFVLAIVFLVAIAHVLKQSPVLASLTFGLVARHRRIVLSRSQRGFGVLGEFFTLLLFVFVASTLEWQKVASGIGLGVAIVAIRYLAKILGISLFARVGGITIRKGLMTGIAMAPISVFVILVMEQTRYLGINLVDQLVPLAAASLMMEIVGPVLTQRALYWAHEVPESR